MNTFPKSTKEMTLGMSYFPRMLDKIRLQARGELGEDYQENLGHAPAADSVCPTLQRRKKEMGIEDRDDIVTNSDLIDFDEGRLK